MFKLEGQDHKTYAQLANMFKSSITAISNVIKRNKVPVKDIAERRRKLSLNQAAFEKITPDLAYSGWIYYD